jgi:hypothetical protein
MNRAALIFSVVVFVAVALWSQAPPQPGGLPVQPNNGLGESDGPAIPGQEWRVHDIRRPHPRAVTPAEHVDEPPSDAIVLFDGKDLSKWTISAGRGGAGQAGRAATPPTPVQPQNGQMWKVENGYMEVVPGTGSLATKDKFGDVQLHIEWATPAKVNSYGQYRGNSGVMFLRRLEIQVLDSYNNPTYADGQAGSIYGQWPPLVNPSRKPGEWQSFDIVFETPGYDGDKLVKQAYVTVFMNGILLHNRQEFLVNMNGAGRQGTSSSPLPAEDSIVLQAHPSAVPGSVLRFRNIWARRLSSYDQPESK